MRTMNARNAALQLLSCGALLVACGSSKRAVHQSGNGETTAADAGQGGDAAAGMAGRSAAGAASGGASGAGASDSAAGGGASGTGSAGAPTAPDDAMTLEQCDVVEPCRQAEAQLVEGGTRHVNAADIVCTLDALANLKAGRYRYRTDSTFGNGSVGAEHVVLIETDGTVLYVRVPYDSSFSGMSSVPDPGARCRPKDADYFQACIDALNNASSDTAPDDMTWHCAFGDGAVTTPSHLEWFSDCTEASPLACE